VTTIWERTASALAGLGVDMAANVFLSETGDTLPDQFIVYQLISSPPQQAADNVETLRTYRMQVTVYDRAGLAALPDVPAAMVTAGFTKSMYRELPYNEKTRHFGLAMEFLYLEEE
jgi:hypothetical protein